MIIRSKFLRPSDPTISRYEDLKISRPKTLITNSIQFSDDDDDVDNDNDDDDDDCVHYQL